MNAILRTLIVWLVLLALPFQGFAAAAVQPCDGIAVPGAAPAIHSMAGAGMQHDHASMHHHASMQHASQDAHHHASHAAAKCGCCPACVAGPALAPAALAHVALQSVPSAAIPFDAGRLPSIHPSLPERPPRTVLA